MIRLSKNLQSSSRHSEMLTKVSNIWGRLDTSVTPLTLTKCSFGPIGGRNAWEIEVRGTRWSDPSAFIWLCNCSSWVWIDCSPEGRQEWGLWGHRGGVSFLCFLEGASGFQDVSQDYELGKGRAVPRYRRVSLTTGHCGWARCLLWQVGESFD